MNEQQNEKELMTTAELAELLGWRPQSVHVMRMRGRGPRFSKIGKCVLYRRADVDAWLDAHAHDPAAVVA